MKPREHAQKVLSLPKTEWVGYVDTEVPEHLRALVREHVRTAWHFNEWWRRAASCNKTGGKAYEQAKAMLARLKA